MGQLSNSLDDVERRRTESKQQQDLRTVQAKEAAARYFSRFVPEILPQLFSLIQQRIASGKDFIPLRFIAERYLYHDVKAARMAQIPKSLLQELFPWLYDTPPVKFVGCYIEPTDYNHGSPMHGRQMTDVLWVVYADAHSQWWKLAMDAIEKALVAEDSRFRIYQVEPPDLHGGNYHVSWRR